MKKTLASMLALVLLVTALVLFAACGSGAPKSDVEKIKQKKEIKVAIHDNNMPFEAGDGTGVRGFDVDVMTNVLEIAGKDLGNPKLTWNRNAEFAKCFEILKSDGADMVINAVSITEERKKEFDFSEPYFETGIRIAVKTSSPIQSITDLKGKKVGIEKNSTSEKFLKDNIPDAAPVVVNSIDEAMNTQLNQDEIDAVIGDEPSLQYIINTSGDNQYRLVGERLTTEQYGIVFKKGSDLKPIFDKAIAAMKASGKFDKLKTDWKLFDKEPQAAAEPPTTATAEPAPEAK